jgi:hypothetical protein
MHVSEPGAKSATSRTQETRARSHSQDPTSPNFPSIQQLSGGGAGGGGGNSGGKGSGSGAPRRPTAPVAAAAAAAAAAALALAAAAARRASRAAAARGGGLPTARMHGDASTAVAEREAGAREGAAAAAAAAPAPLRLAIDPRFEGTWIKLREKSSSMEHAFDAFGMSGLTRRAAGLVRGVSIHLHPKSGKAAEADGEDDDAADPAAAEPPVAETEFEFAVFSALPLIKVRERYVIDGPSAKARRRDLRRGTHTARAVSREGGAAMRLEIEWPDPYGGRGYDEFRLNELDELVVTSEITMLNGERVAFHAVHRRK